MTYRKKGVVDVEFVLAIIVFLSIVVFVSFSIISHVPTLRSAAYTEDLKARAYHVSQFLVFEEGEPRNWNSINVLRIGLSNGTNYVLNSTKISETQTLCQNNYPKLKELTGQNLTDVTITITDPDSNVLLSCGPTIFRTSRPEFQITRFAVLESTTPVSIIVSIL